MTTRQLTIDPNDYTTYEQDFLHDCPGASRRFILASYLAQIVSHEWHKAEVHKIVFEGTHSFTVRGYGHRYSLPAWVIHYIETGQKPQPKVVEPPVTRATSTRSEPMIPLNSVLLTIICLLQVLILLKKPTK